MKKQLELTLDKNIVISEFSEVIDERFTRYAFMSLEDRALPDARDGLKPSQRRVLLAMNDLKLSPSSGTEKSSKITGDCFVAGTLISGNSGLTFVEQIKKGDKTFTQNSETTVKQAFYKPLKPLKILTLDDGRKLHCTPEQEVKIFNEKLEFEWKQVKDLNNDDYVVTRQFATITELEKLDDFAYIAGYFLADGWFDHSSLPPSICFADQFKHPLKRIQGILKKRYNYAPKILKVKGRNLWQMRIKKIDIISEILINTEVHFNKSSSNIYIPDWILKGSANTFFSFLSGYIDGNGWVRKKSSEIGCFSISEIFIRQLQVLLHHHGINSCIKQNKKKYISCINGKYFTASTLGWSINIYSSSIKKLSSLLDLSDQRKRTRLANHAKSRSFFSTKQECIPYVWNHILSLFKEKHLGGGWYLSKDNLKIRCGLKYKTGTKIRYSSNIKNMKFNLDIYNRLNIKTKLDLIDINQNLSNKIKDIEDNQLIFIKVKTVEDAEAQVTFDFEVKDQSHELIAQGIVAHNCMGNFHPHGDMVIYPTMYRLAQSWVMRYPLIIGQGNFGNIDGDPPAAQRYTEAKLSQYGAAMFADFSSHSVPFKPNYNEKREEPIILPALIPNLIINGCEGIAVGWATKMLPHNLKETVDVIKSYIKNPNITSEDVIKIMPGPDFPTGGKILNQQGVLDYYKTGHGSIVLEGNYEIEHLKGERSKIIVTQLPYQTSPAQFCVDVEKFVDSPINKLDGIQDLKNLSSKKTGIYIVVEISKGCNPKVILNNLLKNTCLRKTISVNATVLINNKVVPNTPILKLIEIFVEHRKTVLTNKFNYELTQSNNRIHILEGLISITDKIDAVIAVIRNSDSPENAEQTLIIKKFVQSIEQAKAVLAITLRQLTKLESDKLLNERDSLKERVNWLIKILASKKELEKVIIKEQDELVKKMGDDRKTMLSLDHNQIEDEDLIPDEKLIISLTGEGYLKSIPVDQYRIQNRGGQGSQGVSKNTENVIEMFEMHSKDHVLFFTNKGLVYQKRAFEISQSGKVSKGLHVSNMLNLSTNEYVNNMVALKDVNQKGFLVIVTKKGYIKKTHITEYDTSRKNAGIKGVKLIDSDEVAFAFLSKGDKDIFIVTSKGRCVRYNEKIIPIQGRGTRGSVALKLEPNDHVVQVMPIDSNLIPDIFVVTTGGFGKKTSSIEYKSSNNRNVKGYSVMSTKSLLKTGNLIGACCLGKNETILLMTSAGKCIRLSAEDIKNTGRTTMGVKIVKLDSMDSVIKVAKLTDKESNVV